MVNILLTGTFVRSVDEKRRIAIPKRLREALHWTLETTMYLAPGTDGSLTLFTQAAFAELASRLAENSPTAKDVRAFSRLFYARAQRVELDRQGRVRVPPDLADLITLGSESVMLGVRDHVEIWDREKWEQYQTEKQAQYDEIAERAFDF